MSMSITERRRSKDMSLGDLARKANLGTVVMSRIERGKEKPPDAVLESIAQALEWTLEELKASLPQEDQGFEVSDCLLAMSKAMEDAKSKGIKKGHGGASSLQCPICKGVLNYSVASVNGHVWGRCATAGCVSWMQ